MDPKRDLKRNGSGYLDLTAYDAIVAADEEIEAENRFKKLLSTIFYICDLAGFHIEGRLKIKDKRTGKLWE